MDVTDEHKLKFTEYGEPLRFEPGTPVMLRVDGTWYEGEVVGPGEAPTPGRVRVTLIIS